MAKKKQDHKTIGFSFWDTSDYLRECQNIVRWNPRLAIDWMEGIASRIWTQTQIAYYNRVATDINTYLDNLEHYRFYDKFAVWENDRVRRIELL
jgi:hypothetical protein